MLWDCRRDVKLRVHLGAIECLLVKYWRQIERQRDPPRLVVAGSVLAIEQRATHVLLEGLPRLSAFELPQRVECEFSDH